MSQHFLRPLFAPLSVVRIRSATTIAEQLISALDLCILELPSDELTNAVKRAVEAKCKSAMIISSYLSAPLEQNLKDIAISGDMVLQMADDVRLQRPSASLNLGFKGPLAGKGTLALVSQSGALTSSMLDWAASNDVGFSSIVSLGTKSAIDVAQVLDFLASDEQTQSIVVYLESVSHSRSFMSALRSLAFSKTVIILKSGRDFAGRSTAQTHSAVMTSSDSVFDTAIARAGAIRVNSFVELFSAAKCLASRYRAVGKRVCVICNGAGLGRLAADWINTIGLTLAKLNPATAQALQAHLPKQATLEQCINLSESANEADFLRVLAAANNDPQIDGLIIIYAPNLVGEATTVAQGIVDQKATFNKPVLTCWMGDSTVVAARRILTSAGIPSFRTPESAVGAFGNISAFYENQQLLQQTPAHQMDGPEADVGSARLIIAQALAQGRTFLNEIESKSVLSAFRIPVTQTILARTANEALVLSTQIGCPVALKIESPDVIHKSDVQGVALNVSSAASARDTFIDMIKTVKRLQPTARISGITVQKMAPIKRGREVYVGVVTDAVFGPVIQFGAGGTMVELINDHAMELPPLNQFLAKRLIARARVSQALGNWQGNNPIDRETLEQILLRVSDMVCALPQLREMDINPIIIDDKGAVAVDARIVVGELITSATTFSHLAIEPYPVYKKEVWLLDDQNADAGEYSIRPIRPDDAELLQALVKGLSPESAYFRFVSQIKELPAQLLARFTLIDYDRDLALVSILKTKVRAGDGTVNTVEQMIGVSRFVRNPDQTSCEFALLVADQFAHKGVGARLMQGIIQAARNKQFNSIMGLVLHENKKMLRLVKKLGFTVEPFQDDIDFKLVSLAL